MKTIKFLTLALFLGFAINSLHAQDKDNKKINKVVFETSITCDACVNTLMSALPLEKGVKDVDCNLETKKVTITYKKDKNNPEKLRRSIEKLGYTAKEVKNNLNKE